MKNVLQIVENECPYCNEILYVNKRVFANHIRWCKKNPRYEEILEGYLKKERATKEHKISKKNREIVCPICNKTFVINTTEHKFKNGKYRKTCSDECAKKLTALKTDKEAKNKKIAKSILEYVGVNGKIGAITVRNFHSEPKEPLIKGCKCCGRQFDARNHPKQECCCPTCARNYRRLKEIKDLEEQKIYRSQAKFKFALNSYPNEFEFNLIKESGWYKASNHGDNLKGISRDHMFSVDEGYKQGIDPYLISHPANCKLMKHEDNFKKLTKCSITLDELQKRINEWNSKYGVYENKIVYDKIERFKTPL